MGLIYVMARKIFVATIILLLIINTCFSCLLLINFAVRNFHANVIIRLVLNFQEPCVRADRTVKEKKVHIQIISSIFDRSDLSQNKFHRPSWKPNTN